MDKLILGIETSCDETSAAVVLNGVKPLSNVIFSQIDIHKRYGGVVPEIASRNHLEKIGDVVSEALETAGISLEDLDGVAVTMGPGLVGALLVGVAFGKALAYAAKKPLVGVNHIEGHICANYIDGPGFGPPFVCLIVSGGHTHLVYSKEHGIYDIIGKTRDDAAGEAFDKTARALGLPYPGGIEIDRLAKKGNPGAVALPRADLGDGSFDFSFSGLKSAVLNYINRCNMQGVEINSADVAASFQEAVCDALIPKAVAACRERGADTLALAGGVASNSYLRLRTEEACARAGLTLRIPRPGLCTDNAAMIASAGFFRLMSGRADGLDLNAVPGLAL